MKRPYHLYIWQDSDWPNFIWEEDKVRPILDTAIHLHGQLKGVMSLLGFEQQQNSSLSSLTDELLNSSAIEGVNLNPASVRSSIARRLGIDDGGLLTADHYVEGLVDVMLDATQRSHDPLSAERLFGWHAALFPLGRSGMYRIRVGGWREGDEPMQVVSGAFGHERVHYEAPPSKSVAGMMRKFIDWCNEASMHPLLMAAIAHLWMVTIHPFDDGNGRLSRTLADLFLARLDDDKGRYYSMSAEINRNKKTYYHILEKTQKGSLDITDWLVWFMECLIGAINRTLDTISRTLDKSAFWESFRGVEVNERQRKVINRLWDDFEGKLTTSKWAKICHCSQDTALRDINDLLSKGLLIRSPEGGRSAHYLLPSDLTARAR